MLSISPSDVFTWIGSQPCFSRLQPALPSESFVPRRKWLALTRHPNLQVDSLYLKNGTVKFRVPHVKTRIMSLNIPTSPAPLFTNEDGVVRVGGTRVRLETVVYAFNQGVSAEKSFSNTLRWHSPTSTNDQLLLPAPKFG